MQSMFDMFYLSMGAMSSGNISSHEVFVVGFWSYNVLKY